jgi:DNA repair exonuclease SbcCD ATPase subunit
MNLTRLRLENFKRHKELEFDLVPGLNIVRGPNEAGKTTVQQALEMVLFRRPSSSSQDLDDAHPWRDEEADPIVEIGFEDEGASGALRKTFAGQRGTVEMSIGDETLTDPAAVEAKVAALTGLPTEKFFRATASVRHQELSGLTQDESTLRDRLQQSMSGADRGTHAARRKLEEAIRRYKSEGAKNPGYLKTLRADVQRLSEKLTAGEAALVTLERDRQALAEARAHRTALDANLAEQRASVATAERAAMLSTKLADATRRYDLYRRASELRDEIAKLDGSHPSKVPLQELRSTVEGLRNLEFDLSEMRAELAAEPDLSGYDVAIATPRWRPWAILGAVMLIAAVGAAAFGFVGGSLAAGLGLAVLFAVVGGFAIWRSIGMRRQLGDIRMQNELRESEIARRLAGRTDLAERVRQAEQERAAMLSTIGTADVARAESVLAAETDHVAQVGARKAEYRGMMGDRSPDEDVAALRDAAAAEADECRHTLAGMGEIGEEAERQLAAFRLALQKLGPEREAAIHAEAQADARVSANATDAEVVAADSEALEAANEALAAAERRLRIYEDTLTTLNNSERATMKKAARFLEQRMARDIERVTGGRYRRLRVDEATLTFTVYSPEADEWLDVRQLSQGTLDQLYLCARLGIVRQVTQPANPPLIFDDPFITFDDERARRALTLLKDISREHQVIYLTTSDRYDAMADKVVELTAPTERDEPEPVATPAQPVETLSMWQEAMLPAPVPKQRPPANDAAVGTANGAGTAAANGNGHKPVDGEPDLAPLWPVEER